MRIYRPQRRNADGTETPYQKFYCELRTTDGRIKRVPGFADKRLTESLGRNVQRLIDCRASGETLPQDTAKWIENLPQQTTEVLARWGLLAGSTLAAGKALGEHLADWECGMMAKGMTRKHAMTMHNHALRIFTACNAKFLADIRPGDVQSAIAAQKTSGLSLQTCNHLTKAVKAFTRWACRDGRLQTDPLAHLTKFNTALDRRHDRRGLTALEAESIIQAAETGPAILGMDGHSRAMLYRTALGTGFRAAELRSLTPESFNLDGQPPTITIRAAYSKHRRQDVQPIRRDLADTLRTFIAGRAAGTPVFAMPEKTCKVMQADLASARAKYIGDAATDAERAEREQSGFCLYSDAAGRYADFHALRHTYITRLVKSNASVKVCQELARHSDPKLTFAVYSHVGMADTGRALDNLPGLDNPQAEKQTAMALKTGTNGLPVNAVALPGQADTNRMARRGALLCDKQWRTVAPNGANAENGTSEAKPLSMQESCDNQGQNETALAGTRTRNIPLRRRMLYPIELRARAP